MANQIRMTPEMMRTRASQYTTQAGNLQDIINAMDRLLTQLRFVLSAELNIPRR